MPLPFLLLFRFNPKQGCAPAQQLFAHKSWHESWWMITCVLFVTRSSCMSTLEMTSGSLRAQCWQTPPRPPKPSRHLQSAHTATSHRHLCPFPLSLTRHQSLCSHTSPPATPTRITSTADPHTHPGMAIATACFRKVDILLLKNPPSGRIQYLLLLGQPFLLVFRIFTASLKRSSQHWHTVTQPLTDSRANLMGEGRASFRCDCVSHKTEERNQSFVMVYADAPRRISGGTRILHKMFKFMISNIIILVYEVV